jgi:hypothetical protein
MDNRQRVERIEAPTRKRAAVMAEQTFAQPVSDFESG